MMPQMINAKKVYFHIGHGKTGSSAIQALLAQNHERLKESGILYPFHNSFQNALKGFISSGNINAAKEEDWLENQVANQLMENPHYHTYIFSSETLFMRLPPLLQSDYIRSKQWDIRIFLVVRNPIEMIASHHQQAIKRGGYTQGLKKFIFEHHYNAGALQSSAKIIKKLDKLSVRHHVINYSAERYNVSSCLANAMGIGDIVRPAEEAANQIVNRSLTAQELTFVASANALFGKSTGARLSDALVNELPTLKADRLFISEEDISRIREKNNQALEVVNKKLASGARLTFDYHATSDYDLPDPFDDNQLSLIRSILERRLSKRRKGRASAAPEST